MGPPGVILPDHPSSPMGRAAPGSDEESRRAAPEATAARLKRMLKYFMLEVGSKTLEVRRKPVVNLSRKKVKSAE